MKRLGLYTLFLLLSVQIYAQPKNETAAYALLYKLDPEVLVEFFKTSDEAALLRHVVGKPPVDTSWFAADGTTPQLPQQHGAYLVLKGDAPRLSFQLLFQHSFAVSGINRGKKLFLHLYNRYTYEPITEAVVHTSRGPVYFSEKSGGYLVKARAMEHVLIKLGDNLWITEVSRTKNYRPGFFHYPVENTLDFFESLFTANHRHYGYLALNKPRFRPGDTLQYKVFALNKRGRAADPESIYLEMSYYSPESRRRKKSILNLEQQRKASFAGHLPLGDSLDGQAIQLKVRSTKNEQELFSTRFTVEDYKVDEIDFDAEVLNDKLSFSANLPLRMKVSAFAHSGLPVLDGQVQIRLQPRQHIDDAEDDIVVIPETILDTSFYTDPSGEHVFTYFPEGWSKTGLSINAEIEFRNSEMEYHQEHFYLTYSPDKLIIQTKENAEGVWIRAADTTGTGQELKLESWQAGNYGPSRVFSAQDSLLYSRSIKLPHFEKWKPEVDYYQLYDETGEFVEKIVSETRHYAPGYWLQGDSLVIVFPAAHKNPVHYEILLNGRQQHLEGVALEDTLRFARPRADYLVLKYMSLERNSGWSKSLYISLSRDMVKSKVSYLNGKMEGPARIHPGDSVNWKISVQEGRGRPYAGMDLVALSVKKGFSQEPVREIMPLPRYKRPTYRGSKYRTKIRGFDQELAAPLSQEAFNRLNLREQDAFRYYFREEGLVTDTFTASEAKDFGQFAAFVYNGAAPVSVYAIYANNVPVYAHHLHHSTYSFPLEPGNYTIRLRCRNYELEVPGVEIFGNAKTEIAVNLKNLPAQVKKEEMPPYFTKTEYCRLTDHTLFFENPSRLRFYFEQGHKWICDANQSIAEAGPFEKGQARYWNPLMDTISFYFEPGQSYRFHQNVVYTSPVEHTYRPSQFPYLAHQVPGQVLPSRVRMYSPKSFTPIVYEQLPDLAGLEVGELHLHNLTDSSLIYYQLYHYEEDTLYYGRRSFGSLSKWQEGTYRLQAYGSGFTAVMVDSIPVKKAQRTHVFLRQAHWISANRDSVKNQHGHYKQMLGQSITGRVRYGINNETIPLANVLLKNSKGEVITGTTTDFDGIFELVNIPRGNYQIEVSYVSFQTRKLPVEVSGRSNTFIDVELLRKFTELQEVTIMYSAPLIDKTKSSQVITVEDIQNMAVRDVAYVAAQAAGVTRSADGSTNIRGARAGGTVYFIDGVKVRGSVNLPQAAISTSEVITGGLPAQYGDAAGGVISLGRSGGMRIKNTSATSLKALQQKGGGLRKSFSDYAFFIPDLTTDKNGEAVVKVQYPDDVTAWETTIIGMDEGFKVFKRTALTSAFSEVSTRLAVPVYLRQGDTCIITGTTLNYLDIALQVKSSFQVNGISMLDTIRNVTNAVVDKLPVAAIGSKLNMEYHMQLENAFRDGERREVPVQKTGIAIARGEFLKITSDTSFSLTNKAGAGYAVSLMNGSEAVLLQLTDELAGYPYACNEQLASRLRALLAQKLILEKRGEKFRHHLEVKRIIRELEKAMNTDAAWGWWPKQPTAIFMTTYVLQALHQAKSQGYEIPHLFRTEKLLEHYLLGMKPEERVEILYTFNQLDRQAAFEYFTRHLVWDSLSTSEKLKMAIVFEDQRLQYDSSKVEKLLKEDVFGKLYVASDHRFALMGSVNNSLLMARWLQLRGRNDSLALLKDHLLMTASLSQLNTLEKAAAIDLLMHGDSTTAADADVHYQLNGKRGQLGTGKPLQMHADKDSVYISVQTKQPVYLTYYQREWEANPQRKEEYFSISMSWINRDGKPVDQLQSGEPVTLKLDVDARKAADYVMIRIPKPAGMVYQPMGYSFYTNFRENKSDHLMLYINRLPEGQNSFEVQLMPRFSGRFHMDPAQVELMYFPVFNGHDEVKKVVVK